MARAYGSIGRVSPHPKVHMVELTWNRHGHDFVHRYPPPRKFENCVPGLLEHQPTFPSRDRERGCKRESAHVRPGQTGNVRLGQTGNEASCSTQWEKVSPERNKIADA
ncbi:hypothetical protein NL676_019089 [Syzygium grande]|nr:hypothetical protein NL676_019089 [Syzygium grande]